MSDSFLTTYSGLDARLRAVEVITNNLANSQTGGFKRDFAAFVEREETVQLESRSDLTAGDIIMTGNPLDAAIDGPGFFSIETPSGVRYTRGGSFSVNGAGELVTKDGMKLLSTSGQSISIEEGGTVSIDDDGSILIDGSASSRLRIVDFKDPKALIKDGLNRFLWTGGDQDVTDVQDARVKGGALEKSNVNPVEEMVRLISAYREFESVQRALRTTSSEMNAKLIQELGKLS